MTIERYFGYKKHLLIEQLDKYNAFIFYLDLNKERLFRLILNNETTASKIDLTDITDKFSFKERFDEKIKYGHRNYQTTGNVGYPGTILCVDATELSNKKISDKFWSEISQTNRRAENPHQRVYVVFLGDIELLPEDLHQFSTTTN